MHSQLPSDPALRVKALESLLTEKGLVVSQQGRGTIVRDNRSWNMLDPMILSALFQGEEGLRYLDNLSEVRTLLESAMAAKAAANATPEGVAGATTSLEVWIISSASFS